MSVAAGFGLAMPNEVGVPITFFPANGQAYTQYGYFAPNAPAYSAESDTMVGSGGQQDHAGISTVVVTGFPNDVKDRELNNLMLLLAGYQASTLLRHKDNPEGRALFSTPSEAQAAIDRINGFEFDQGYLLQATMATENLELPEDAQTPQSKRLENFTTGDDQTLGFASSYGPTVAPPGALLPFPASPFSFPRAYAPVKNEKDNPPCNTLFIGNLGENVDERELTTAFATLPGFVQLKIVRGPRGISAFIEFADVPTATAAHESQQGLILSSSDRGPLRVQYSKNPFGRKRDISGGTNSPMGAGMNSGGTMGIVVGAGINPGAPLAAPFGSFAMPTSLGGPGNQTLMGYGVNSPMAGTTIYPGPIPPPPPNPPNPVPES